MCFLQMFMHIKAIEVLKNTRNIIYKYTSQVKSSYTLKSFLVENGYEIEDLIKIGLVSSKTKDDIYKSRIIFPIKTISPSWLL